MELLVIDILARDGALLGTRMRELDGHLNLEDAKELWGENGAFDKTHELITQACILDGWESDHLWRVFNKALESTFNGP